MTEYFESQKDLNVKQCRRSFDLISFYNPTDIGKLNPGAVIL